MGPVPTNDQRDQQQPTGVHRGPHTPEMHAHVQSVQSSPVHLPPAPPRSSPAPSKPQATTNLTGNGACQLYSRQVGTTFALWFGRKLLVPPVPVNRRPQKQTNDHELSS
jgi:hypothetical protein